MAIGKTAYIRNFTDEELKLLQDIAQTHDIKNATDVLKFCLLEFPKLVQERKQLQKATAKLHEELKQERKAAAAFKERITRLFEAERAVAEEREAIMNIVTKAG